MRDPWEIARMRNRSVSTNGAEPYLPRRVQGIQLLACIFTPPDAGQLVQVEITTGRSRDRLPKRANIQRSPLANSRLGSAPWRFKLKSE